MKLALTKKQIIIGSIVIAVAIVIVLVAALGGNKKSDTAEEANTLTVTPMTPIAQNGMRYAFDGIDWELETRNEDTPLVETKVAFYFDNFTRRENGVPATFARPFYIGSYQGACVERSGTNAKDEQLLALGISLGFVFCDIDGQETFIGLFQKDKLVSAYRWDTTDAEPVHIRDIDITTIVKDTKTVSQKTTDVATVPATITYPPRRNKISTQSTTINL